MATYTATSFNDDWSQDAPRWSDGSIGRHLHFMCFSHTWGTTAPAENDELDIGKLPPGRISILRTLSSVVASADKTGKMNVGYRRFDPGRVSKVHNAYGVSENNTGTADADGIAASLSIDDAGSTLLANGAQPIKSLYSQTGFIVYIQLTGSSATFPAAADKLHGHICFIRD